MRTMVRQNIALGLASSLVLSILLGSAGQAWASPTEPTNLKQSATPTRPATPNNNNRPTTPAQPSRPNNNNNNRPTTPAQPATPRQEVIMNLIHVPVFVLADAQGSLVVSQQGEGQQQREVVRVFITRALAQQTLDELKSSNPQLGNTAQVTRIPLAEIYYQALQPASQNNRLVFAFVPIAQEVQNAQQVLQGAGQQAQQFNGVPLFFIAHKTGENRGFPLAVRRGEQSVAPFYFRRQEAQEELAALVQQQPNLNNQFEVQVASLSSVLESLQGSTAQQLSREILLIVPPRESAQDARELIQSIQQAQGQQGRPGQPGQQQAPANRPAGQGQPQRPAQPQPNQRPAQPQPQPARP